jgi:uncharacterized protein YcfL
MRKLAVILIASMMLCACGSKTAEYYEQHPDEMKAKMEQCKRLSSLETMADRECKAATDAYSKRFFKDHVEKLGSGRGKELPKF